MPRMALVGLVAVAFASTRCSDVGANPCLEEAVLQRISPEQNATDWRAEIDSLVAAAPADSVLQIIAFVEIHSRQEFEAWSATQNVPITYVFYGFSGYVVTPKVDDLTSLKDVSGVTGLDWGIGSIGPNCP
jgi:hypothetical protein